MRDSKRMNAVYVDFPAGGGEGTAPKVTGGTGSPANIGMDANRCLKELYDY